MRRNLFNEGGLLGGGGKLERRQSVAVMERRQPGTPKGGISKGLRTPGKGTHKASSHGLRTPKSELHKHYTLIMCGITKCLLNVGIQYISQCCRLTYRV